MNETKIFSPGDPVPGFSQRSTSRADFQFGTVAGIYVVLTFFTSAARPGIGRMLDELWARTEVFNDRRATFFGVSCDPDDEARARVAQKLPGYRVFWDFDRKVSNLYGLAPDGPGVSYILDRNLRVIESIALADPATHAGRVVAALAALPDLGSRGLAPPPAPVLVVPRVFEPAFCRELIALYEAHGGEDSGFMREHDGQTVKVVDYKHKRRRDAEITSEELRRAVKSRMSVRLKPEVAKAFSFVPTRIERYIVACYDAEEKGHFRPHRDNTTKGTAHRRFAVTINLNAEEYDGGDLRFPEYDSRVYRAPTGGAVVFSCSVLHEATRVTRGRRYAFLPFLYDESAAQIRLANAAHIADPALRAAVERGTGKPRTGKSGNRAKTR